jgi:L-serine/L-threonine ammonia-lyase
VLRQEEAHVEIHGRIWQQAHTYAVQLSEESNAAYLHPFDHPLIWTGHATLIDEVRQSGIVPDVVVLSVGGGGLLCGIIEGLRRNDLADVPILAAETEGADSLAASLRAGQHVEIEDIKSIATSLGAKKVASAAYEWCSRHEVASHVVSDREAVAACLRFSQDHRLLVEPACGASLAALYDEADFLSGKQTILAIVCGGVGVTISQLEQWESALNDKSYQIR